MASTKHEAADRQCRRLQRRGLVEDPEWVLVLGVQNGNKQLPLSGVCAAATSGTGTTGASSFTSSAPFRVKLKVSRSAHDCQTVTERCRQDREGRRRADEKHRRRTVCFLPSSDSAPRRGSCAATGREAVERPRPQRLQWRAVRPLWAAKARQGGEATVGGEAEADGNAIAGMDQQPGSREGG